MLRLLSSVYLNDVVRSQPRDKSACTVPTHGTCCGSHSATNKTLNPSKVNVELSLCLIQRRALELKNRSTPCLMKNRSTAYPHVGCAAHLGARRLGRGPFVLIRCWLTGPQSCFGRFENLCPCRGSNCRHSHKIVAALSDFVSKIKPQKFAIDY